MDPQELIRQQKYDEAASVLRSILAVDPDDERALEQLGRVLRIAGSYAEAIPLFEQLAAMARDDTVANRVTPGSAPWQVDIACLRWLSGQRSIAINEMHGRVTDLSRGRIEYAEAHGGMSSGLLLYYMAVTLHDQAAVQVALSFLATRVAHEFPEFWPWALAQYVLGKADLEEVLKASHRRAYVAMSENDPRTATVRRIRLAEVLFYDGVKARSNGDERNCLTRMNECVAIDVPARIQEHYLAREEVRRGRST